MFTSKEKLKLQLEDKTAECDYLQADLDELRDTLKAVNSRHEDEVHRIRRSHDIETRTLREELSDLIERTSAHEDELNTLKAEKQKALTDAVQARKALREAVESLETAKHTTRMQREMLEHNARILKEKSNIESKRKELELQEEYQDKEAQLLRETVNEIGKVKEECHERIQTEHAKRSEEFRDMMKTLVKNLPKVNVNAMVGGHDPYVGYDDAEDVNE